MTPQAERLWQTPMSRADRDVVGKFLAGAQYFDCAALEPIIAVRSKVSDTMWVMTELIAAELPSAKTWLQLSSTAALLISDSPELLGPGERYACAMVMQASAPEPSFIEFRVFRHAGRLKFFDPKLAGNERIRRAATMMLRSGWFSIEAMQTPGGLCHEVVREPSRQASRQSLRSGRPVHRWVEIRLGRARPACGYRGAESSSKTVAWHYRRGHRVNHPNPNYPKWRKGCWVGDVSAGIRSHSYVVEVPA